MAMAAMCCWVLVYLLTHIIAESTDIFCAAGKLLSAGAEKLFEAVAAVVGEAFFVADFYHGIGGGVLHDLREGVGDAAYEQCRVFICKTTARGDVAVGVNVENVAGALTVIFLEPAAGLPGAGVVRGVGAGEVIDWNIFGEAGGVTGGGATR